MKTYFLDTQVKLEFEIQNHSFAKMHLKTSFAQRQTLMCPCRIYVGQTRLQSILPADVILTNGARPSAGTVLMVKFVIYPPNIFGFRWSRVLSYYSDLTLSQEFQPMAAQLSMKAALPLAKTLATASCRSSKTGPCVAVVGQMTSFNMTYEIWQIYRHFDYWACRSLPCLINLVHHSCLTRA